MSGRADGEEMGVKASALRTFDPDDGATGVTEGDDADARGEELGLGNSGDTSGLAGDEMGLAGDEIGLAGDEMGLAGDAGDFAGAFDLEAGGFAKVGVGSI